MGTLINILMENMQYGSNHGYCYEVIFLLNKISFLGSYKYLKPKYNISISSFLLENGVNAITDLKFVIIEKKCFSSLDGFTLIHKDLIIVKFSDEMLKYINDKIYGSTIKNSSKMRELHDFINE